jgi:hypothetical protein
LSSDLDDRLDVTEDHVSNLQEHVKKLQEQADALTPAFRDSTAEAVTDIKAGVAALNALVAGQYPVGSPYTVADLLKLSIEMKGLYEDMEAQNAVKLSARGTIPIASTEALVCHCTSIC